MNSNILKFPTFKLTKEELLQIYDMSFNNNVITDANYYKFIDTLSYIIGEKIFKKHDEILIFVCAISSQLELLHLKLLIDSETQLDVYLEMIKEIILNNLKEKNKLKPE